MNPILLVLLSVVAGISGILFVGASMRIVGRLTHSLKETPVDADWDEDYMKDFNEGIHYARFGGNRFVPPPK